jgi:hypothetical protein
MKLIKDRFIPRKEISNLLFNMGEGISTHSLSMWLKSKTDDEWVVVPKNFCTAMIEFVENEFKEVGITKKGGENQFLQEVKQYL